MVMSCAGLSIFSATAPTESAWLCASTMWPSGQGVPADFIVFNSNRTGNYELYVMRNDGTGQAFQLTEDADYHSWWGRISPDRRTVYFQRSPSYLPVSRYSNESGLNTIWKITAGDPTPRLIYDDGDDSLEISHTDISPDGSELVVYSGDDSGWQIYALNTEGDIVRQLTPSEGRFHGDPGWSPDGKTVLYIDCPTLSHLNHCELCVVSSANDYLDPDAPHVPGVRLTFDNRYDHDPDMFPDGMSAVWTSWILDSALFGLRSGTIDGAQEWIVMNGAVPQVSADGEWIYYHEFVVIGWSWEIFRVRPDGTDVQQLTSPWSQHGNNEFPSP